MRKLMFLFLLLFAFACNKEEITTEVNNVENVQLKDAEISRVYYYDLYFEEGDTSIGISGAEFIDILYAGVSVFPYEVKYIWFSNYNEPSNVEWTRTYSNGATFPLSSGTKYTANYYNGEYTICFRPTQPIDLISITAMPLGSEIIYDDLPFTATVDYVIESPLGIFSPMCRLIFRCHAI